MFQGLIKFTKSRYRYGSMHSWLLAAYSRILRRFSVPLPFRGCAGRIRLSGIEAPFLARLGTSDFHVLEEIYFNEEYAQVVNSIKEPVNLILDLGSNVGYSLRYWQEYFPNARIIAVEPDDDNASLCMENVTEAGFSSLVEMNVVCVGAHARNVNLSSKTEAWAIHMEECTPGVNGDVSVLTVPQLIAQISSNQPIDLLKCDIEGAEAELFDDCGAWINRVRHMIVELHPPYTCHKFLCALENSGTEFVIISITKQESLPVIFLSRA